MLCISDICSSPRKDKSFLGTENARHFLVNHMLVKWLLNTPPALAGGS